MSQARRILPNLEIALDGGEARLEESSTVGRISYILMLHRRERERALQLAGGHEGQPQRLREAQAKRDKDLSQTGRLYVSSPKGAATRTNMSPLESHAASMSA